jgi:hypothetical protein
MIPLLLAALLASGQPHGPVVHATDVKSDAGDDLTEKFAVALRKALPSARHMRPETGDDADDLFLTVLFPVEVDGRRFSYAVDLLKAEPYVAPERIESFTGTCREAAIDACAQALIAKADKRAKD